MIQSLNCSRPTAQRPLRTGLLLLAGAGFLASCDSDTVAGPAFRPELVTGGHGSSSGRFHSPRAVAVDPRSNRFFVVDRTGRIQAFEHDGRLALEWRLPEWAQGQPVGIFVDSDGTILVNDSHYHRILRYSADGAQILSRWGKEGKGPGEFTFGRDVVADSQGFIYAGDYGEGNDRIQKFTADGGFVRQWGRVGSAPGEFQRPQGMAIDTSGGRETLWVTDAANHRLQHFTLDGELLGVMGSLGRGPGELRFPYSVAAGGDGTVYVCEWGNNRVQRLDSSGRSLGSWGEGGRDPGQLSTPWDIARGPDGRFYVADFGNHRVQGFQWPASLAAAPLEGRRP